MKTILKIIGCSLVLTALNAMQVNSAHEKKEQLTTALFELIEKGASSDSSESEWIYEIRALMVKGADIHAEHTLTKCTPLIRVAGNGLIESARFC